MDIRKVNLLQLADVVLSGAPVPAEDVALINRILFENMATKTLPEGAMVVVLGNPTCVEDRIGKALDVVQECGSEKLMVCGGVRIPGSTKTEAMAMYDYCLRNGVAQERIIVENQSTTTRENIIFAALLMGKQEMNEHDVVVVSSASHMRRVHMDFEHFNHLFPGGIRVHFAYSVHPSCDPKDWHLHEDARRVVATELRLVNKYLTVYDYAAFEI